jgi:hypothetical protein
MSRAWSVLLAEPDRQLLVNVRWLAGFRERPADPDGQRARMLSVLAASGCTVGELVAGAREPMLARPVPMRPRTIYQRRLQPCLNPARSPSREHVGRLRTHALRLTGTRTPRRPA